MRLRGTKHPVREHGSSERFATISWGEHRMRSTHIRSFWTLTTTNTRIRCGRRTNAFRCCGRPSRRNAEGMHFRWVLAFAWLLPLVAARGAQVTPRPAKTADLQAPIDKEKKNAQKAKHFIK